LKILDVNLEVGCGHAAADSLANSKIHSSYMDTGKN
jgi:hypothetical protein